VPLVPIAEEAGCTLEAFWMLWRKEKPLPLPEIES